MPNKATVALQLHPEKRIGEAGEVVVINAAIYKSSWKTNLPDVVLDGELGGPQRHRSPAPVKDGMVGHAAVNKVLNASGFGRIRQCLADCYLVTPVGGVDEGQIRPTREQSVDGASIRERAFDDGHIFPAHDVLSDNAEGVAHLSAHLPSHRRGASDETSRLPAGAVDGNDSFSLHQTPSLSRRRRRVEEWQDERVRQATTRLSGRFCRCQKQVVGVVPRKNSITMMAARGP